MNRAGNVRNNNYKATGSHGAQRVQSGPACMSPSAYIRVYTNLLVVIFTIRIIEGRTVGTLLCLQTVEDLLDVQGQRKS